MQAKSDGLRDSSALEDIVLEAAGYAEGDHSISTREQMKLNALIRVLDKKHSLSSWVGPKYIADDNPGFYSCLFPRAAEFLFVLLKNW